MNFLAATCFCLQVIIPDETGSKVVLKNLSRRDAGLYICTANNQVNEGVEKVTKITVKCKKYSKYLIILKI